MQNTPVLKVVDGVNSGATETVADPGDREILEKGEARVLARSFQGRDWLERALKVSERIYGKGSGERIKAHMRRIWKEEMCK